LINHDMTASRHGTGACTVFLLSSVSHLTLSLCFFFSRYCARRDPHSFPTRRSSDLHRTGRDPAARIHRGVRLARRARRASRTPRSEEHTSELQSLRHLVCRLLLEKKKKKTRRSPAPRTYGRVRYEVLHSCATNTQSH